MNIEVKGNLARLLATENLIVEHRSVESASFDIKNRILTLPVWNTSPEVYDMLVGHEVGHALYTPHDYITHAREGVLPQSYLNVVEDARIEKMMKRKFPGLARSFYTAYVELYKKDFFGIGERSFDTYTLIDRINLYFKIGIHASAIIPFNEDEKKLVEIVEKTETFEDVIEAVRKIIAYTKEKEQEKLQSNMKQTEEDTPSESSPGSSDNQSHNNTNSDYTQDELDFEENSEDSKTNQKQDSQEGEQEEGENNTQSSASTFGDNRSVDDTKLESETDKSFNDAQKNLVSKNPNGDPIYLEIPDLNLDTIVINNKTIHEELTSHWKQNGRKTLENYDRKYNDFRKSAQREVNYLVKEFEMRKSADRYARSSQAKTGVLNTSKLHTYKWNEDLFKKVNVIPDGKNHGLIFVLDWSGSMGQILKDTVKQLFNLIWFCKKVQIPFDLYLFTNDYSYYGSYYNNTTSPEHQKNIPNTIYVGRNFNLLNVISSESKSPDLETQMKNFWKLTYAVTGNSHTCPGGYYLSGTPLDESVITLHKLIPDFQKRTRCQKTNVIILTDGEAQSISRIVERPYSSSRLYTNSISRNCVLRNRKNGRIYKFFDDYCSTKNSSIFLQSVRDSFPDVNIIGIRLADGHEVCRIYESFRDTMDHPYEYYQKIWAKEKSLEFKNVGYESLYILSSNNLSAKKDYLGKITDESNTSELKSAFSKTLKSKAVNKKMLSSFAKLIS